jgi:HD superfamily phosphohydrolase
MTNLNTHQLQNSLSSIYDPIHGAIDITDASQVVLPNQIARLLNSPMLDRLRRVKQLGYASHHFPAADHSRYAHALGSLHMMRSLIDKLESSGQLSDRIFPDLNLSFPSALNADSDQDKKALLRQHLLVAALLQDVGELPYAKAVNFVFKASESLRQDVQHDLGFEEVFDWTDKDIFTVASMLEYKELLEGLDLPLLVFLITGRAKSSDVAELPGMLQLRQMLDGQVDADRLDYVFRDAHHTIGAVGTPQSVVQSLLYYDEAGPLFSDPNPVSDFLMLRANLWTTVYFSPQNRFRLLLMTILLKAIQKDERCSEEFFGSAVGGQMSLQDFIDLDDVSLNARIKRFAEQPNKNNLKAKAKKALQTLTGRQADYECTWLPQPSVPAGASDLILPGTLFYDTYSNYQDHSLYKPNTIRIKADRFKLIENPIPLERCCGAFSAVFKTPWSALPMPQNILLFVPKKVSGGGWDNYEKSIKDGSLYRFLLHNDVLSPIDFPDDTRMRPGFSGPSIFISFTWADVDIVERIARLLLSKRRRYFMLFEDFSGLGGDPKSNSVKAVKEAEAVIMLVSSNYVARVKEEPNGNLGNEVAEIIVRVREGLKLIPLSADNYKEIEDMLPWFAMNFASTPMVGKPLRYAPTDVINSALDEGLKIIDGIE